MDELKEYDVECKTDDGDIIELTVFATDCSSAFHSAEWNLRENFNKETSSVKIANE